MFENLKREFQVVLERDPAARNRLEIFLCYPGFHAIVWHRVAHFFYRHKWFLLARIISQLNRHFTDIEIHPGAKLGRGVFIDHGSGIVIGETAEVGDNVTLYQGVTLGGTGKEKGKRHPTIGSNVTISTGAKVLGSFTVGDNVRIGAGSVVLKAVPANCTVVGVPGRVVLMDGRPLEHKDEIMLDHNMLPDPVADAFNELRARIGELEARLRQYEEKGA